MITALTITLERVIPRISVGISSAWPSEPGRVSLTQNRGDFPGDRLAELVSARRLRSWCRIDMDVSV